MDGSEEQFLESVRVAMEGARGDITNRVNTRLYIVLGVYTLLGAGIPALFQLEGISGAIGAGIMFVLTLFLCRAWQVEHLKIREAQQWLLAAEEILSRSKPKWVSAEFQLFEHFSKQQPSTHTKQTHIMMLCGAVLTALAFLGYMISTVL